MLFNTIEGFNNVAQGDWAFITLSATQTNNLAVGDHIEFDMIQKAGGISLTTGIGQENGIITLTAGKSYVLTGSLRFAGNTGGHGSWEFFNRTELQPFGIIGLNSSPTSGLNDCYQPYALGVVTPNTTIEVDLRINSVSNRTSIIRQSTFVLVQQVKDEET